MGKQIEALKDHTHLGADRQVALAHLSVAVRRRSPTRTSSRTRPRWALECDAAEQRALAGPARADDGDLLAHRHVDADPTEHLCLWKSTTRTIGAAADGRWSLIAAWTRASDETRARPS